MRLVTALAAPTLLAVLGLAACDDYNQDQANQPGAVQTDQQTGAVPPGSRPPAGADTPSAAPGAGGTTTSPVTPGQPPADAR